MPGLDVAYGAIMVTPRIITGTWVAPRALLS